MCVCLCARACMCVSVRACVRVCVCVTLTSVVTGAQTDGSVFYSLWFWLQLWMLFEVCGNKVVACNPISLNSPSLSIKWCGLLWFLWGFGTLTRPQHRPIRRGLFTKWNVFYKLDYSFCYILHDSWLCNRHMVFSCLYQTYALRVSSCK